jgi:hypothetical protein
LKAIVVGDSARLLSQSSKSLRKAVGSVSVMTGGRLPSSADLGGKVLP